MPDAPDSVEQFAADLKMLRIEAGNPTLGHLQHETGISRTVISAAYSGRQLPSTRTVHGLVRACGGDPAGWLQRRDLLAAGEEPPAEPPAAPEPDAAARPRPRASRRRLVLAGIAAFAIGAVLATGVTASVMNSRADALTAQVKTLDEKLKKAGPVNPHAQIQVRTGIDPAMTPCVNDAKVAASDQRSIKTAAAQPTIAKIEIIWSNKCYAGWARITRYDAKPQGNAVTVAIYPETAPTGPDRQQAVEPDVQGAYTTLLVRPSPATRLCATGSFTLDGKAYSMGAPICT